MTGSRATSFFLCASCQSGKSLTGAFKFPALSIFKTFYDKILRNNRCGLDLKFLFVVYQSQYGPNERHQIFMKKFVKVLERQLSLAKWQHVFFKPEKFNLNVWIYFSETIADDSLSFADEILDTNELVYQNEGSSNAAIQYCLVLQSVKVKALFSRHRTSKFQQNSKDSERKCNCSMHGTFGVRKFFGWVERVSCVPLLVSSLTSSTPHARVYK